MIYELVSSNDPCLRRVSKKFVFLGEIDPVEFAVNLTETMLKNNGIGISAPQVGINLRVIAISANPVLVMFNPLIVDASETNIVLEEGCLSYPDLFVKVKRPKKIKIRYFLPNGDVETSIFEGLTARIIQHEMDHLDGICHIDRANKIHLEKARRERKSRQRSKRTDK